MNQENQAALWLYPFAFEVAVTAQLLDTMWVVSAVLALVEVGDMGRARPRYPGRYHWVRA